MIGIGVDIVNIARVERVFEKFGERFARKVLAPSELQSLAIDPRLLAKRFAAKEAVAKALGTGFRLGITMPSIRIEKNQLPIRIEQRHQMIKNTTGAANGSRRKI